MSVDQRTGSDWMSTKKNHFPHMKLQKSFRCKTANYSILCESYLHHGPVKTNSFILYYTEWPLDIISGVLCAYFLLSDGKRKKKVLFHSQFQKSELPLSYMRIFLEDPLAALSGPLWDCRSERKMLCRESQTPDVEKKKALCIYQQSQTDGTDFNSSYKQDSSLKM